jgi:ketosteroid isomerase-like protein
MTRDDVDRWLADYVAAWKSYDPEAIGALFAEDVEYRYHPYDEPVRGRDAVVEAWVGESDHEGASSRDAEGTYDGSYRTIAVDGDVAVATGESQYSEERGGPIVQGWDNCFVMRFDPEGRCREFTEWFIERPKPAR